MTDPNRIKGGGHIIAADIRQVAPLSATKSLDQQVVSSQTMVADSDLFLADLEANAVYDFSAFIVYEGGTNGASDLSFRWDAPSNANLYFQLFGSSDSNFNVVSGIGLRQDGVPWSIGTNGAGVLAAATMWGTLRMSTTPGTLSFHFTQTHSNATPTIVHGGSELKLIKTSG